MPARSKFTRVDVEAQITPLIEFAWASGLLKWSPEQYEKAMSMIFPKTFGTDEDMDRRIVEAKRNRVRAIKQLNNASESETASELGALPIDD